MLLGNLSYHLQMQGEAEVKIQCMKQAKYLLVPKYYLWKCLQIRKYQLYSMSKISYEMKFFNLNSFHVRVVIIIIIWRRRSGRSAREENIHIFSGTTDIDSMLAYMCVKVQTEFDLLNISLRCW